MAGFMISTIFAGLAICPFSALNEQEKALHEQISIIKQFNVQKIALDTRLEHLEAYNRVWNLRPGKQAKAFEPRSAVLRARNVLGKALEAKLDYVEAQFRTDDSGVRLQREQEQKATEERTETRGHEETMSGKRVFINRV
jgi:hypothetical protein